MTCDRKLIEETLGRAQEALHQGGLSRANLLLQRLHAAGHASAASHQMLAIVAVELGFFDHAERHIAASRRLAAPADARTRYLLIRAWGAGFAADVQHTIHGLVLAEAGGRVPVIHWGRECRYRRPGVVDAWRLYFEPVSDVTLADLRREGLSLFPPKWTAANLDALRVNKDEGEWSSMSGLFMLKRDEDVVVFDFYTELEDIAPWLAPGHPLAAADPEPELGRLYRRHLRLLPRLAAEVDRLEARLLKRRPMLAMHYRTQSLGKLTESANKQGLGPDVYVEAAERYLRAHPDAGIYLITDFAPAVAYFGQHFGERMTTREVMRVQRVEDQSIEFRTQHDGVVLGDEVLLDSFLAARCDAFIGDGASGVSIMVGRLKDWPAGGLTLFRPGNAALAGRVRRHMDPSPWWNPTE
jgi:hypothetical protein